VDALYSGATHCPIETEVTFEDGRKGSIRADLAIREAVRVGLLSAAAE
jgi:long-chain acyl-CoA synthetase